MSMASAADGGRTTGKIGSTISAKAPAEFRIGSSKAIPKKDATACGSPEGTWLLYETVSTTRKTIVPKGPASST